MTLTEQPPNNYDRLFYYVSQHNSFIGVLALFFTPQFLLSLIVITIYSLNPDNASAAGIYIITNGNGSSFLRSNAYLLNNNDNSTRSEVNTATQFKALALKTVPISASAAVTTGKIRFTSYVFI